MTYPPFIQHYMDQLINDTCIEELRKLSHEYQTQVDRILNNETVKKENADLYNRTFNKNIQIDIQKELSNCKEKYTAKAAEIALHEGKNEGIKVIIYREPKNLEQQKHESQQNLDNAQNKANRLLSFIREKEQKRKADQQKADSAKEMGKTDDDQQKDLEEEKQKEIIRKKLEETLERIKQNKDKSRERD